MSNQPRAVCQDCGGPKEPGRGRRYCAACTGKPRVPTIPLDMQLAMVRAYNRPRAKLDDVAAQFFCSRQTVQRVLALHDVTLRPTNHYGTPRIDVDERLRRTQLYGRGLSLLDVANVVGRHPSAVLDTLRREGVRMRPQGVNLHPHSRADLRRDARGRFTATETS